METVEASEAKKHLSNLLERVAKGESITIEKQGVPIAVLNPVSSREEPVEDVIAAIREFRSQHRLRGRSIGEMIEEGRR